MGIGLAICHSIVAAHRGSMTATNNADGGADLPRQLPARHRIPMTTATPTVFVVDDDPGVRTGLGPRAARRGLGRPDASSPPRRSLRG